MLFAATGRPLLDGLRPALAGLVLGLMTSAATTRLIRSLLYGTTSPYRRTLSIIGQGGQSSGDVLCSDFNVRKPQKAITQLCAFYSPDGRKESANLLLWRVEYGA